MEQQRRQPRPQVGGGTVSVALCSASLDGQWDVGRIVCSFCTLKTLRFACLTNNFSLLSLIGYGRSSCMIERFFSLSLTTNV
ncbi:putative MFS-type transporter YcaD [Trichinella pseudospiralis]